MPRHDSWTLAAVLAVVVRGTAACSAAAGGDATTLIRLVDDSTALPECQLPTGPAVVARPHPAGVAPCEVVAVPTGIALRPSLSGAYPDPEFGPWARVARDRRGRFYSTSRRPLAVLAWDSLGNFERVVAAQGQGPGEVASAPLNLFVTSDGDSLIVLDGAGRVSIFDAEGNLTRSAVAASAEQTVNLVGDAFVYTSAAGRGSDRVLEIIGTDGSRHPPVGRPRPGPGHDTRTRRPSTIGPRGDVWIAPHQGVGEGFVIDAGPSTAR